jgi:LmbE family N-acetylglucosaminyl deacetylase
MAEFYAHVYLSPHLDDAVLSCGGAIHQQVMVGRRPLVVTLFAGRPPANVDLSDFARSLHVRWRDSADLIATRWAEDQAALAALGADYLRLNYPDCIYRGRERAGEWYYASEEAIFGSVHPAEQGLPVELAATLTEFIPPGDDVTLYAPLTAGNHVDHQLAFATAFILKAQGWQIRFYEDYPYAEADGAVAAALTARSASHWQSTTVPLDKEDLEAKIRAIAGYESQVGVLFGSVEAMSGRVRDYVAQVGGERLWQLG